MVTAKITPSAPAAVTLRHLRRGRIVAAGTVLTAACALAGFPAAASAATAAPSGSAVSSASAASAVPAAGALSRVLYGVAATSARNAWAVGSRFTGTALQTLIEHWNGQSWKQVPSPDPGGKTQDNELLGVTALSARSAWAVGIYAAGSAEHSLIEHWNGRSWRHVPSPKPCASTGPGDILFSVAMASAGRGWAVGAGTRCPAGGQGPLILRWNGRTWKRVHSPEPGTARGASLAGITATAPGSAWAVGSWDTAGSGQRPLIEHWNGRSWRLAHNPVPAGSASTATLAGVAATSAGNAWAVGTIVTSSSHRAAGLILRWNGRAWRQVKSPNPGGPDGSELLGVAALSARAAWAVGDYTDPLTGQDHTLVEHWGGRRWRHVRSPSPASPAHDLGLASISVTGSLNAWAVGSYASGPAEHMLREHWNGKSWRMLP